MTKESLLDRLSAEVGEAFAAEGLDAALGRVQRSGRKELPPFQCNGAMAAAKAAGKPPRVIAEAVAARLAESSILTGVTIGGPGFLNFDLPQSVLVGALDAIAADDDKGAWQRVDPERIIIDYGGPNVAKPLHVGHLRAAIIGECLKRLFRTVGDDVLGDIHLGDWGLQMGQLIAELKREQPDLPYFAEADEGPYPAESPVTVDDLARLYPKASAACKEDPARLAEAQEATVELQSGRPGYRALWQHFVDVSKAALEKDYGELGVTFDLWKGEADVDPLIAPMVDELQAKGLLEESDGARVIRVAREDDKKEIPPLLVVKSNGSVGYGSTDLATIIERKRELSADRVVYVVDARQREHFEQVFRAADLAGYMSADRLEHMWFGTMNGTDGKPFKTRAGGVLRLRDLIDQVVSEATKRLDQGGMAQDVSPEEKQEIARRVGIAALKFADLSNPRTSDYVFDPERFVTFEGKTGPYLQYATVRIRSVLQKAGSDGGDAPLIIEDPAEIDLALELSLYADAVQGAYEKRMPHVLCDHAFTLAQAFSRFYANCRIGDEADGQRRSSRLRLSRITFEQLNSVLTVLGIPVPEKM
ncbi:arginine--tRNA ligase [Parvularcula sp. LCG005]|uniref:arginine--tRNA ligase n=1 Tax=Parvularcula sp. LCG005 TaxID=3078805 RepID=UPI0029426B91|nr:arginine--tRNA ligase [Parvularcula sp. LCG005]WOI53752.1 arginine--tRNA ligase [Parvularcula sp. LCG005]